MQAQEGAPVLETTDTEFLLTRPMEHQHEGARRSRDASEYALFMEMGTAKTLTDIMDTLWHQRERGLDGWFIVAPKGCYLNWLRELEKHLTPGYRIAVHAWAGGKTRRQTDGLGVVCRPTPGTLRVFVMNVEALSSSKKARAAAESFLRSCGAAKFTVDESTTIKTWNSERCKWCCRLGRMARWRRILTGMPVTKSPMDVFGQFLFLRPGLLGHSNYYSFRGAYAVTKPIWVGPRQVKVIVGFRNLSELQTRVARHSYRVTRDQCLDLPPITYMMRDADMSDEQWRVYRSVRDDATARLDGGGRVTATEVIVQMMRLHQVVCGHVVDEDQVTRTLPCPRIDNVLEWVEETGGQQLVIWATFRHDVTRICEALRPVLRQGQRVARYDGLTTTADRALALKSFGDGTAPFWVGNPATGGLGVDGLQRVARDMLYYSNSYSLEHRAQSEARLNRQGQERAMTSTDLRALGTIDEKIIHTLRKGIDVATLITGDNYREWLI